MPKQVKKKDPLEGVRLDDLYDDPEKIQFYEKFRTDTKNLLKRNDPIDVMGFTSEGNTNIPQNVNYGKSHLDSPMPSIAEYLDYQETRARRQSELEQIANGVMKGAITTGTTFVNTMVNAPVGVATAIAEGRFSGLWDNVISRTMSNIDDWAEQVFPNYYTRAELNSPWYSQIFTANFIGDKIIKNFGFSFGAGGAARILGKMPKLLTTIAPKIAKAAGRTAKDVKAIGRVTNTFETGFLSAIGESTVEALNSTKEWSAAKTNDVMAEKNVNLANLQQEYEANVDAILKQYGNSEMAKQLIYGLHSEMLQKKEAIERDSNMKLAQIASQRAQLGNAVFGFNVPILTLQNMFLLGRVFAGGWSAEQRGVERFISSKLTGDAVKDAEILAKAGTTSTKTTRNLLGKEVSKEITNNVYKNNLTLARNIARGAKQAAGEGVEEMLQLVASNTAKDYNDDYYANAIDPDTTNETANMWNSLRKQVGETFGDINNYEEFFIGMLSGGISNIVLGANKGLRQERQQAQELVDLLNNRVNTFSNRNMIQGLNRHSRFGDQMVEAAIRGDKKDYKDAEFAQAVSDVIMWSEAGKIEDLKQIIDYNLDERLSDQELDEIAESLSNSTEEDGEINKFASMDNDSRRDFLRKQKDKYHKIIDMYTEERNNLVGLVGNVFNREELSELTYLRLRAQDSANRSKELKQSLADKFKAFYEESLASQTTAKKDGIDAMQLRNIFKRDIELYANMIKHFEDNAKFAKGLFKRGHRHERYYRKLRAKTVKTAKKRIADYQKLIESTFGQALDNEKKIQLLQYIFSIEGNNKVIYNSALEFIKENFNEIIDMNADKLQAGNVFEVGQNIDNLVSIISAIQASEAYQGNIKELETTIEDAVRLVADAHNYNQKLNEFLTKPEKLKEKNKGLVERIRDRKIEKDAEEVLDDIANTEDFNEFNKKLNKLDPRVRARVIERLKERNNTNAQQYEIKTKAIAIVTDYIQKSDNNTIIKQSALGVFSKAAAFSSVEDLVNIDNPVYSRENNYQLDDNTYQQVISLLAKAFNHYNNETSLPKMSDTLNVKDNQTTTEKKASQDNQTETIEEQPHEVGADQAFLNFEDELGNENTENETSTTTEPQQSTQTPATPDTHGLKPVNNASSKPPVNIGDNNLTNTKPEVDERVMKSENPTETVLEPDNSRMITAIQETDRKKGPNYGKPVTEEVDENGNPTKAAINSRLIYNKLKELGAFENVDNGVAQVNSRVYFALIPSLDKQIKEQNNYDGTTVLLYVDGKCIGHLSVKMADKLGIIPLLKEEFKGKTDTEEVLISKKYYTLVNNIWSGKIFYDTDVYRVLTNDDLDWIRQRMNSSVTDKTEQTPILTIFDGETDFKRSNRLTFDYGGQVAYAYMVNPLYKGCPVLLVPNGNYDRNKPTTLQNSAYIPVALRRVKLAELNQNTKTFKSITAHINALFKPNLTVEKLNKAIGELKTDVTYEWGKQQVFILPAKQVGNKIVELTPRHFEGVATKRESAQYRWEHATVTHLIIQHKVDGKVVGTYTVGIAQGDTYSTQSLPQDLQEANKQALLDFFMNTASAYVNIDKNHLWMPEYVQQLIDDGCLKTNAKELRSTSGVVEMLPTIMTDNNQAEQTETTKSETQEQPPQSTQETGNDTTNNTGNDDTTNNNDEDNEGDFFDELFGVEDDSDDLRDLLGDDFDSTKQPETKDSNQNDIPQPDDSIPFSKVTTTTKLNTIDVEKEVNNILRMLPQLDRQTAIQIINDLITINDKGEKAQGMFNRGIIIISRLAEAGTGYHEAFHLVFKMLLTNEERESLFNEYRKTRPELNELELEEAMADDFKEYALLREHDIPTSNWVKRVGNKLLNMFRRLFNFLHLYRNHRIVFNEVCSNIWQGKYAYRSLQDTSNQRQSTSELEKGLETAKPEYETKYQEQKQQKILQQQAAQTENNLFNTKKICG